MSVRSLPAALGAATVAVTVLFPLSPAVAADAALPVWGSVATPNLGTQANTLNGIDVLAADDIWAVGDYDPGRGQPTLLSTQAQHWDGTRWQPVPTVDPSFPGVDVNTLESVSGIAADDVWAVGFGDDVSIGGSRTLAEHWDGRRWRVVPTPNPHANGVNKLHAVVAAGPDSVWAVGESGTSLTQALILRFDGTRWRPVPNRCGGPLQGITDVPGTGTLWAVGEDTTCFYDGQRWIPVAAPGFPRLQDVSAAGPDAVWAVGVEVTCNGMGCYSESVAQRWTGRAWVRVPHPLASSFEGVQVNAADDVWAVGTNSLGARILHWDGQSLLDVPSPDPGRGGGYTAIDAAPGGPLWSAGSFYDDRYRERTLTAQAPSPTKGQVIGTSNIGQGVVSWFGPVTGSTATEVTGEYNIPDLPSGSYLITLSDQFGGCTPSSVRVVVMAGQTTVQQLRLNC